MDTRLDDGAAQALRDLYDDLTVDGRVLDLGSAAGEQFNLPPDELVAASAAAPLPYADASFDDAVWFAGIGRLADPLPVFAEVARVLRPGGRFVCTFTDGPDPASATREWVADDDAGRVRIVRRQFALTAGFGPPESDLRTSLTGTGDRLWAVWATRAAPAAAGSGARRATR